MIGNIQMLEDWRNGMEHREEQLLQDAVMFEQGHLRRSTHILQVYALTKIIANGEKLSKQERNVVQAAAILHDIAIKVCKEKYQDASQSNQKKEAPELVMSFLNKYAYDKEERDEILDLVLHHHDYSKDRGRIHQVLIEADLLVGCFEHEDTKKKVLEISHLFQTETGKRLLECYR